MSIVHDEPSEGQICEKNAEVNEVNEEVDQEMEELKMEDEDDQSSDEIGEHGHHSSCDSSNSSIISDGERYVEFDQMRDHSIRQYLRSIEKATVKIYYKELDFRKN